jgi:hypothetical protein
VISAVRFVYDGVSISRDTADRELARFNDYIKARARTMKELRRNIGYLTGVLQLYGAMSPRRSGASARQ